MIFTFIQLLIMFITVYLCVYSLIDRVLKCIEHCATAKAYGKFREAGIMTKMEAVEKYNQINKGEGQCGKRS